MTSSKLLSLSEPHLLPSSGKDPHQACPRNGSPDLTPAPTPIPVLHTAQSTVPRSSWPLPSAPASWEYFLCCLWRPAPRTCWLRAETHDDSGYQTLWGQPTDSSKMPCTVAGPCHRSAAALPTRETRACSAHGPPLPRGLSGPHRLTPRRAEGAAGLPCPRSRRG